ncbi:MAG: alcohol dehydrogenase catalytic domain-containing protein [Armatimonadetes bacterium]|nr:alcohol dehydrogenase catalytic domain-containing protein [Armatimonadota bacterium]
MKAAIVEKPGALVVREIPEPTMSDYEVRCKLLFGATCTGTDNHLIHGRFPWPVSYPTILGHESTGEVVEVGEKVRNFKVGDRVTRVGTPAPPGGGLAATWGGFAEYGIARDHWAMKEDGLPEQEWRSYRINQILPPDIEPAVGTMFITWRETFSYITRMGVNDAGSFLVIGSGGVGLSFASHARNLCVSRIGMVGNDARSDVARRAGVTDFFDYHAPDLTAQIAESFPEGFDFIIDSVGKTGQMEMALPLLKPGGAITIYGIDDYGTWYLDPTKARGTFTYLSSGYDEAEAHEAIVEFVRAGKLDASIWLDMEHPFSLEEINPAFEALWERRLVKALIRL